MFWLWLTNGSYHLSGSQKQLRSLCCLSSVKLDCGMENNRGADLLCLGCEALNLCFSKLSPLLAFTGGRYLEEKSPECCAEVAQQGSVVGQPLQLTGSQLQQYGATLLGSLGKIIPLYLPAVG